MLQLAKRKVWNIHTLHNIYMQRHRYQWPSYLDLHASAQVLAISRSLWMTELHQKSIVEPEIEMQ